MLNRRGKVFAVDGYKYILDYSQPDFFRVRAINIVYDNMIITLWDL